MYNLFQPSPVRFLFCFHFLLFLLHSCDFTRSGGGSWWNNAHFLPPVRLSHPSDGRKKPIPGSRGKERAGREDYEEAMREVLRKRQEKSQRQRWLLLQRTSVTLLTQREEGQAGDKCSGASSQRQENLCLHTSACFCRACRKQQSQQTLAGASVSQPLVKEAKGGAQNDDAWAWFVFGLLQIRHKITINV